MPLPPRRGLALEQLADDVAKVKLDRLLRYPKLAGDLRNASLFGHKVFQEFLLAIGKGVPPDDPVS